MNPALEEMLALDLLTLREHTERAGDHLDPQSHEDRLRDSLSFASTVAIRRDGALVAYAMLHQQAGSSWFVRAFNIHPRHRTAPVIKELMSQVAQLVQQEGISELRSHVYKTNRLSMSFHRKLGFEITRENEKVVEFCAGVQRLALNRLLKSRVLSR